MIVDWVSKCRGIRSLGQKRPSGVYETRGDSSFGELFLHTLGGLRPSRGQQSASYHLRSQRLRSEPFELRTASQALGHSEGCRIYF